MRAAHGLGLTFTGLIGVLIAASVLARGEEGDEDPSRPDRGALAPLADPQPASRQVGVLDGAAGRIQDLAAAEDGKVVVLTMKEWFLLEEGALLGGFGDVASGAPGWLSRPVSIAVARGRVHILDAGRMNLSVWDTAGRWLEDIPVASEKELGVQPVQVVVGPDGAPIVLAFRLGADGVGMWVAQAHEAEGSWRVVLAVAGRSAGALFDRPILAFRGDELMAINALDHSIWRMQPGDTTPHAQARRPDPPLWLVPGRIRREYEGMLRGVGGDPRVKASLLPEVWPSVRDFSVMAGGEMLLTVTAGEERQHLEVLDPAGVPSRRFSRDGFAEPVFVDRGRAFVVHEEYARTVIREFILGGD